MRTGHPSNSTRCGRQKRGSRTARRGAVMVELALVLPFLVFLIVASVDFARIYYYAITIENCAMNGAIYGSDDALAAKCPYGSIEEAALADAANLTTPPTVSYIFDTDASNNDFVRVTVSYDFQTVTNFPVIGGTWPISRTVQMRLTPSAATDGP